MLRPNNNTNVAPKDETKEKKKGGGMFSSGMSFVGDMSKKAVC